MEFSRIKPYQPRVYLSDQDDLSDLRTIAGYYQELLGRQIDDAAAFEQWVLDRSEWESAIDQIGTILYIQMTCQTDNEQHARAYTRFIENIAPEVKVFEHNLDKRFVQMEGRFCKNVERYFVFLRNTRADLELFVEKNIKIETEIEKLSQQYQAVCGKMTVHFKGREQTLPEMGKFLLDTDRNVREEAWRATAQRRLENQVELDSIFDQMLTFRVKLAQNAGFENFTAYKFKSLHRFDYSVSECLRYHQIVEKLVVPLQAKILSRRKEQMGLAKLRPWDLMTDVMKRPPLHPFGKAQELIRGCQTIFSMVDKELGEQFGRISAQGLLDLESRKGKAPGGYQSTLNESRMPFVFMNAVGLDSDVRTLLHEGGHAFHALACAHDPLLAYRHGPMEFCEVASMSMELLGGEFLSVFYNKEDWDRSCVNHLEDIVSVLVWVATVDAFQHWIYGHPNHNPDQRRQAWIDIRARFGTTLIDWNDLDEEHAYLWHRQLHIFEVPFYYIEYAIAQLGALQIWKNYFNDPQKTIGQYKTALCLGGSRPLPDLFHAAGIQFVFDEEGMAPLVKFLDEKLFTR